MGEKSGFPPGPASGLSGPCVLYALGLACIPAWLFPGKNDVPTGGSMASTPWSPLRLSAFNTPSPTTGQRNAADAVFVNAKTPINRNNDAMRILLFKTSPP